MTMRFAGGRWSKSIHPDHFSLRRLPARRFDILSESKMAQIKSVCPKCATEHTLKDSYCSRCGLELFKYKTINKKPAKDISAEDIFYYYGTVSENNKITDWVKDSLVNFLKQKSKLEDLYGGLTREGELRLNIAKIGYFKKLTEDLITKEHLNYSGIKTKNIEDFKNREDWLLYHSREMVGEKLDGNDLMRDSILKLYSLLNADITDEAARIIGDGVIVKQMLPDFYKDKMRTNTEEIMNNANFCFYLGYWAKFFENVYSFLNKR